MPPLQKFFFFLTVFTTGAAVLIFEVAAVRALSPYFGASIYVVSSVLTVILAALSIGYYFGGRFADKYPDARFLYLIICISGFVMNLLYGLSVLVFPLAGVLLPITYGPLILSLLFFLIPAILLGIDSPFVIKLLTTDDTSHNGSVVGSTFFWSTLGSIVGSLATGFFLIPIVGLKLTFVGTATFLSVFACAMYLYVDKDNSTQFKIPLSRILLVTVASVLVSVVLLRTGTYSLKSGELLYKTDGYYSEIEVREHVENDKTIRDLRLEVNHSSAIEMGTTTFVYSYNNFSRVYQTLKPDAENFLLIGGGAYNIPRTLLQEDTSLKIDVIEIEPSLIDIAHEYFELPTSTRLTNFTDDARYYLNTSNKKYDVIFLDAFQSGHFIPPQLITKEFFDSIANHLTPEGILIINAIGSVKVGRDDFSGSLVKTVLQVFPQTSVYRGSSQADMINLMLISRNGSKPIIFEDTFTIDIRGEKVYNINDLEIPIETLSLEDKVIFTDDRAPVELMLTKQILQTL